jgi:proteic killer suppression protein
MSEGDFRHKGLRQLFEDDNPKGVNAEHVRKIKQILALLEAAQSVADLDYVGFRLHPLKGDLKGFWSLTVRANWRIIFRFDDGHASDVDLVDYH